MNVAEGRIDEEEHMLESCAYSKHGHQFDTHENEFEVLVVVDAKGVCLYVAYHENVRDDEN